MVNLIKGQFNMVNLIKPYLFNMANLIKGQIMMVNLIKPCPLNMANLTKPWPFWWTFVHFDYIFGLTLGKNFTLIKYIGQM